MAEPIISDRAYYSGPELEGEDHPRCKATPKQAELRPDMVMAGGTWGCALPKGHERFAEPRHRPHSWIQTGARE
jgi:hypothetical protein